VFLVHWTIQGRLADTAGGWPAFGQRNRQRLIISDRGEKSSGNCALDAGRLSGRAARKQETDRKGRSRQATSAAPLERMPGRPTDIRSHPLHWPLDFLGRKCESSLRERKMAKNIEGEEH
jgi:hypothetical protein